MPWRTWINYQEKFDMLAKKQAEYESKFNAQKLDTGKNTISEASSKSEQQNLLLEMSKDIQLL